MLARCTRHYAWVPAAAALALAGCGQHDNTARDYNGRDNPSVPPSTGMSQAAPASPASGAEPAPTPATHAGTPQAPGGPTAQDTTANQPQGDLTKQQESSEMPKAGQTNNYNSPAYEPKKGAGGNQ